MTLFIVGFFALCFGFVRACDWIIGPDSEALPADERGGGPDHDQPTR